MIFAIKSPYLNSEIPPETLVIFADNCSRLPEGKNKPTNGLIISSTKEVTNLEDAWPITNANARPIIPNVLRKSKNCMTNVLVGTGSFGDDDDDGMSFPVKLHCGKIIDMMNNYVKSYELFCKK